MKHIVSYFLYTLTSLFTIVNPLSAMPFYNSLIEGSETNIGPRIARRATIAAFVAMLFFGVAGKFVFSFFNISIDGLRVVGGILFFISGYDMLQGRETRTKSMSASERLNIQDVELRAITPLAIPLITGPGTITFIMVAMHESVTFVDRAILFVSAVVVSLATYFILIGSKRIISIIGESGQKVFIRLMGLILMMIAVEYFFAGLRPYVHRLLTP